MSWAKDELLYPALGTVADLSASFVNGMLMRAPDANPGAVRYQAPRHYRNVWVFTSVRAAVNIARNAVSNNYSKFIRQADREKMLKLKERQGANNLSIVNLGEDATSQYESLQFEGDDHIFRCINSRTGDIVREGIIFGYLGEDEITVRRQTYSPQNGFVTEEVGKTKGVVHTDGAARVSVNSQKNVLVTKVVGRDYARKELLSGGDYHIQIDGKIVSPHRGVYPADEVSKLANIAAYDGVIQVRNLILGQLGITQMIVLDLRLGVPTCLNEQPYSMTCVAIEPDEEIEVSGDTLSLINTAIQESPADKWYSAILNEKMFGTVANAIEQRGIAEMDSKLGTWLEGWI